LRPGPTKICDERAVTGSCWSLLLQSPPRDSRLCRVPLPFYLPLRLTRLFSLVHFTCSTRLSPFPPLPPLYQLPPTRPIGHRHPWRRPSSRRRPTETSASSSGRAPPPPSLFFAPLLLVGPWWKWIDGTLIFGVAVFEFC
jgi:hypothetical protein